MKKIAILLTLILSVGMLSACGPKSIEEIEGQEYECAQFSALCPSDWANVPVYELNNPKALLQNRLRFFKTEIKEDEEGATNLYSNAYVDIGHYPIDSKIFDESKGTYQNVEDVSITVNGTEWKGYVGELAGYREGLLWKGNSGEWQVSFRLTDDDGDVEFEDYDFQAILASIKKK